MRLLRTIDEWSKNDQCQTLFWLKGLAGTGKSTIARTVAASLKQENRLAASFFFSLNQDERSSADLFFTTIAFQLSEISEYKEPIIRAVEKFRDISSRSLQEQWENLLYQPLQSLSHLSPLIVVIDSLDACENKHDVGIILRAISQTEKAVRIPLRLFITSRPEQILKPHFDKVPSEDLSIVVLHEVDKGEIEHDIQTYLQETLQTINQNFSGDDSRWPSQEKLDKLTKKIGRLFIYAATVCRLIEEGGHSQYIHNLDEILRDDKSKPGDIDDIYSKILRRSKSKARTSQPNQRGKQRSLESWRCILGAIITTMQPQTVNTLTDTLTYWTLGDDHDWRKEIQTILSALGSIIQVLDKGKGAITLYYQSFRDFLIDPTRCQDEDFLIREANSHLLLSSCCVRLLGSGELKKNICSVRDYGILNTEISDSTVNSSLSDAAQYACQYWVAHLQGASMSQANAIEECDADRILAFLEKHFLHWLEACSLLRKVSEAVSATNSLVSIFEVSSTVLSVTSPDSRV